MLHKLNQGAFAILERDKIGATFQRWPKEMRFITPSFTSNAFGLPDLNAVDDTTSPAYTLRVEHPSGTEYTEYMQRVVKHFSLPVAEGVDVQAVNAGENGFVLKTSSGEMSTRFLVWATGEFQYPYTTPFEGAQHCRHSSPFQSWKEVEENEPVIIGGYESGIDAAINLARLGKRVRVIEVTNRWQLSHPDPSIGISPCTLRRLESLFPNPGIELIQAHVTRVKEKGAGFEVRSAEGESWWTASPPILATGYAGGSSQIQELFEWHERGYPKLAKEADESTVTAGLFLVGPEVRHENAILCFIYKFRQRFAVIGREIGQRLGWNVENLEAYRQKQMFLDDLSCCKGNCTAC